MEAIHFLAIINLKVINLIVDMGKDKDMDSYLEGIINKEDKEGIK